MDVGAFSIVARKVWVRCPGVLRNENKQSSSASSIGITILRQYSHVSKAKSSVTYLIVMDRNVASELR